MLTRRTSLKAMLAASLVPFAVPTAFGQAAKKRVAFANVSNDNPFGATVLQSLKEAAGQYPDMALTYMDNRQDAAQAVEVARTVAAARYDLFIEYNAQAGSNVPIWRMMQEAKIPVLAVQIGIAEAPLYAVDNKKIGTESGRIVAEEFKKKWPDETPTILILSLQEAGPFFIERSEAAKVSIAKVYPGVPMIEFSTHNDAGHTRQLVTDTLTRFPGKKFLIWVHIDAMALSALAAVRNSQRAADSLISSTGGDKATFPEIRQAGSCFLGTFASFPELWGPDILTLARDMLAGKDVAKRTYPKRELFLSRENIATYYP
jgi:ribose transport system substrate-binding protein